MKKALSILLAVVLVLSLSSVAVFAANVRPSIKIAGGSRTRSVKIDKEISLDATLREGEGKYENTSTTDIMWESSDDDVATVDDNGNVEAWGYGECTIRAYVYTMKEDPAGSGIYVQTRTKISDTITIRVPGGPKDAYPEDEESEEEIVTPKPATTTKTTTDSDSGSGQIPSSTVTSAVKKAGSYATFKGYTSVSKATVTSANTTSKNAGKKVVLNFDTYKDGKFDGRLTINPANAANMASSVNTSVSMHSDSVGKYRTTFEKFFKNKNMAFIKLGQTGAFGMTVEVVAKLNLSGFGTTKYLYSYNPTNGKYSQVKNATFRKDGNGFWHITTNSGGVLVITDTALAK